MGIGSTLFFLNSDTQGPFDGSAKGISILRFPNVVEPLEYPQLISKALKETA